MKTPVKLFSCTQSTTLSNQIAKHFGQDLGSVNFQRYSDGEFQPSFEESVRGSRVFLIGSTNPSSDNLMEMLLMLDAAKRASARHITAVICLADALFAASSIRSISIRLSDEGFVDPIKNTRDPLTDSSKEGWNSPSLYLWKLTLPKSWPKCFAIWLDKVVLCVQENNFTGVFTIN